MDVLCKREKVLNNEGLKQFNWENAKTFEVYRYWLALIQFILQFYETQRKRYDWA